MELFGGVGFVVARGSGVSLLAVVVLGSGTVVMISMLRTFLAHERYRRPRSR